MSHILKKYLILVIFNVILKLLWAYKIELSIVRQRFKKIILFLPNIKNYKNMNNFK